MGAGRTRRAIRTWGWWRGQSLFFPGNKGQATGWTVPGSNPGRDFPHPSRPALEHAQAPIQWVKQPGRATNHPPPCIADVKERVELYLYFPSGPSWRVLGRSSPLPFDLQSLSILIHYTRLLNMLLVCDYVCMYKVVQIWPGQTVTCLHTNSPGHIWTTLYIHV
jgi:hypothetical protein